jgi:uncharacterized protein (TIGR02677 family)
VISVFEYIQSGQAPLYREIMRVFVDAKEQFVVQLRLQEVVKGLRGISDRTDDQEIESALTRLCEWGNLQARSDTSSVCTVEDFYNPRLTYQLTSQGEAFERALAFYDANSEREHPLRGSCLADIRFVVQELKQLSQQSERNAAQIYRNFLLLFALSEDLSAAAHALIRKLDGRADLHPPDVRGLVEYCRRFLGELELEAAVIGQLVQDIEDAGLEKLMLVVVRRNIDERNHVAPTTIVHECGEWRLRWERFRIWFVSPPNHPSGSVLLRERFRTSLPALLRMSAGISVEGAGRMDRVRDFRVLAKWFAEAASDAEAHILWRAAFGLSSARHLTINDATLGERESQDIPASTSWRDAPPLRIAAGEYGRTLRTDGLSRIIDRTAEKKRLAAAIQEDTQRVLNAQHPFGIGNRIRLSELEHLATDEFELFLDLLGDAISAGASSADSVEILSGDGGLRVRLEPTGDDRLARIRTGDGEFSGPDQWIRIEQTATQDLPEVVV